MGCTSRAHSADPTKSMPPPRLGGLPRASWAAALVFLALILSGRAAQAQSRWQGRRRRLPAVGRRL